MAGVLVSNCALCVVLEGSKQKPHTGPYRDRFESSIRLQPTFLILTSVLYYRLIVGFENVKCIETSCKCTKMQGKQVHIILSYFLQQIY